MRTKFSKLEKEGPTAPEDKPNVVHQGEYLNIINYKDYEFVSESDMVIMLPYLRDEGYVLLRHEYIPTYQYYYRKSDDYKHITNFVSAVSGTVEKNESIENALRRELYEETGIVLSNLYKIEFGKHLFLSKSNVAKYHICILELRFNDYKVVPPKHDGSKEERLSKTIRVSLGDLDDIKTHDLITEYVLTKFKLEYNIK